jgi:hypothetical protein
MIRDPKRRPIAALQIAGAPPNFSIAGLFVVLTLLGADALVLSRVPWSGALAWPAQLWHFSLAAGLLVILLFSARETIVVAIVGGLAGFCVYAQLWDILARQRMYAEIAWYVLYVGLHTGGLLTGIYSHLEKRTVVAGLNLGLMALSIALNVAFVVTQGGAGRFLYPLPPVELPPL